MTLPAFADDFRFDFVVKGAGYPAGGEFAMPLGTGIFYGNLDPLAMIPEDKPVETQPKRAASSGGLWSGANVALVTTGSLVGAAGVSGVIAGFGLNYYEAVFWVAVGMAAVGLIGLVVGLVIDF